MTTAVADPFAAAKAVADTVLYEGYVLYPYRASAAKNQIRWQFGVLVPAAVAGGAGERSGCRTECLLSTTGPATVQVRVRFLQVEAREVQASVDGEFTPVASLEAGGRVHTTFEGGIEHEVDVEVAVTGGVGAVVRHFALAPATDAEPIIGSDGRLAGRIVSERRPLEATVGVEVARAGGGDTRLSKVTVEVENATTWEGDMAPQRALLVRSALVGVHTLLAARNASFVSLLDPPPGTEAAAAACASEGSHPVLVGAPGEEVVLASPIILPEHPEVAPESAGDFCDATEIDEILALRVLTLTDDEKREARSTDPRAAAIVDRCCGLPDEIFSRLHGAIRSLRPDAEGQAAEASDPADPMADRAVADLFPVLGTLTGEDGDEKPWWDPAVDGAVDPWTDTLTIDGRTVGKGAKVRLRPGRRADAQDLFLVGKAATVQGVFSDVDGNSHVAVTVDDDDHGPDLWHGRFLYFHPDEVEHLEEPS